MGMAVQVYRLFLFKYMDKSKARVQAATEAGLRHGVTYGQLVLQWALDQGVAFITPLYHPEYMSEDLPCQDFHTDAEDEKLLRTHEPFPCSAYLVGAKQNIP